MKAFPLKNLVILFFAVMSNTILVNGQGIEYKKNIADSVKYGVELAVKGAYNAQEQKILLSSDWIDAGSIKVFLHELGHHIWFNGGIDTVAILNDLAGEYFTDIEIIELFADQHYRYFFNDASPAFRNIFEAFYNRVKSKK